MNKHDSMRGWFAYELYQHMAKDPRIWLIVGDLGYGVFDAIRSDFSERFINTGAAETAMMDIAVGLSLEGKIPVVYSITPFLIYRPFEVWRTYINHENLHIIGAGSGRDDDYKHDGYSHNAEDVQGILKTLPNIRQYYPPTKEDIPYLLESCIKDPSPYFISLRR